MTPLEQQLDFMNDSDFMDIVRYVKKRIAKLDPLVGPPHPLDMNMIIGPGLKPYIPNPLLCNEALREADEFKKISQAAWDSLRGGENGSEEESTCKEDCEGCDCKG